MQYVYHLFSPNFWKRRWVRGEAEWWFWPLWCFSTFVTWWRVELCVTVGAQQDSSMNAEKAAEGRKLFCSFKTVRSLFLGGGGEDSHWVPGKLKWCVPSTSWIFFEAANNLKWDGVDYHLMTRKCIQGRAIFWARIFQKGNHKVKAQRPRFSFWTFRNNKKATKDFFCYADLLESVRIFSVCNRMFAKVGDRTAVAPWSGLLSTYQWCQMNFILNTEHPEYRISCTWYTNSRTWGFTTKQMPKVQFPCDNESAVGSFHN